VHRPVRLLVGLAYILLHLGCSHPSIGSSPERGGEPLASWSRTPVRQALLDFVASVSDEASASFVARSERVAVFDLDGTMVNEDPHYLEVLVAAERLRAMVTERPALKLSEPFESVLSRHAPYIRRNGRTIVETSIQGESLTEFQTRVRTFLSTEHHPTLERSYDSLFYAPMIELVAYLQAYGFSVFIVSQSQQEYIRAFSEECLGVDRSRVIGSMYEFTWDRSSPSTFSRQREHWTPYNADEGKVLRLRERIGRTPILAFGNSGGDKAVLELTSHTAGSMALVLAHDDGTRAVAHPRPDFLADVRSRGWHVVSLRDDFNEVFAPPCLSPGRSP